MKKNKMPKEFISMIIMVLVFLILPIVGWGIMDFMGLMSHPARCAMIIINTLTLPLILYAANKRDMGFVKKGVNEDTRHRLTFIIPTLVSVVLYFIAPYSDSHNLLLIGGGDVLRYTGLALVVIGYIFMAWGPMHLGKNFSALVTIQKDHELITDGPYKMMRHPRYAGIIYAYIGIPLVFLSYIALPFGILMAIMMLMRIPDEENLLSEHFGGEWKDYTQKTQGKIIPLIY